MPIDQPLSPFQEVHKKIQEARNRIREEQEKDEALRKERSEREDERKGFDRVHTLGVIRQRAGPCSKSPIPFVNINRLLSSKSLARTFALGVQV